jgi:hypothetical protein
MSGAEADQQKTAYSAIGALRLMLAKSTRKPLQQQRSGSSSRQPQRAL